MNDRTAAIVTVLLILCAWFVVLLAITDTNANPTARRSDIQRIEKRLYAMEKAK